MKIGIHDRSGSFSIRWIKYCEEKNIEYKLVNAFDNDIIKQLQDCTFFLWHHHHKHFRDTLVAKNILFSLEQAGIKVFPNFNTGWHFDDKIAQKYILEAIEAPLVPSYVFYDKKQALNWAESTIYPKVFKLKGGAGSANVRLVKNKDEALKLINKAFKKGFPQFDRIGNLNDRINKFKSGQTGVLGLLKSGARLFISTEYSKQQNNERGYVYFQDFLPGNTYDIRIIVIGERAFALKRLVRENDFRASGSGKLVYNHTEIDSKCIEISFEVNRKLNSQCTAFDFIFDEENNPVIVEISYGFAADAYDSCPGYWDKSLNWHEGSFNPQEWILQNIIL